MKYFVALTLLAVVLSLKCAQDGVWPETESGVDVAVDCPAGKYGKMTRYCHEVSENVTQWDDPVTTYCLDLVPAAGLANIDFVFNVSGSRTRFIEYNSHGFPNGIREAYDVKKTTVSVHRITEEPNWFSTVQIRVTLPKEEGIAFYKAISSIDNAQAVAEHLQRNNNIGFRYQYLTLNGEKHCDIFFVGERVLTLGPDPTEAPTVLPTPEPEEMTFAKYMKEHLLWIVICVVELIVIIVAFATRKSGAKATDLESNAGLLA